MDSMDYEWSNATLAGLPANALSRLLLGWLLVFDDQATLRPLAPVFTGCEWGNQV